MKSPPFIAAALLVSSLVACSPPSLPPPVIDIPTQKPAEKKPSTPRHQKQTPPRKKPPMQPGSIRFGDVVLTKKPLQHTVVTRKPSCRKHRGKRIHSGIDFEGKTGDAVFATGSGRIIEKQWHRTYGRTLVIDHGAISASDTRRIYTRYAHLHRFAAAIKAGQDIQAGSRLGSVGKTGRTTGDHLHYEILRGHCTPGNCFHSAGLAAYMFVEGKEKWCER